jgi:hypothetical protein
MTLAELSERLGLPVTLSAEEALKQIPDAKLYTSDNLTVGGFRANQSQLFAFQGTTRKASSCATRTFWVRTTRTVRSRLR